MNQQLCRNVYKIVEFDRVKPEFWQFFRMTCANTSYRMTTGSYEI